MNKFYFHCDDEFPHFIILLDNNDFAFRNLNQINIFSQKPYIKKLIINIQNSSINSKLFKMKKNRIIYSSNTFILIIELLNSNTQYKIIQTINFEYINFCQFFENLNGDLYFNSGIIYIYKKINNQSYILMTNLKYKNKIDYFYQLPNNELLICDCLNLKFINLNSYQLIYQTQIEKYLKIKDMKMLDFKILIILNSINVLYFINIFTHQIINTYKCDLYYEFFSLKFINKNSVLICFIREYEEEMECYQGENFPFRFLSYLTYQIDLNNCKIEKNENESIGLTQSCGNFNKIILLDNGILIIETTSEIFSFEKINI